MTMSCHSLKRSWSARQIPGARLAPWKLESFTDFPINPGRFAAGHMPIHAPKGQAYRNGPWYSLIN